MELYIILGVIVLMYLMAIYILNLPNNSRYKAILIPILAVLFIITNAAIVVLSFFEVTQ
jgi:hypothetical protein